MKSIMHKARWIMLSPNRWMESAAIEVADGRILAVHQGRSASGACDHGSGIIMPALVNAHCHLSLSALAGRVDTGSGFIEWVRQLIALRETFGAKEIDLAANLAAQSARDSGIGLIAEVGPLEPGASAMRQAGLEGIVFRESLGNSFDGSALPDDQGGVSFSFAGHALHTTAPEVLGQLKEAAERRNNVFTMHLAESDAETEFLTSGMGGWASLLESRGIDYSAWDLRGERPVAMAARLGLLGPNTLAVHCLDVTAAERETLAQFRTAVCVCPRSNQALHIRLPDIQGLLGAGITVSLGTDSSASAPSVSIFDEMNFISSHYPSLPAETILEMGTLNGAKALKRHDEGTIAAGHRARLVYIDIEADSPATAASRLCTVGSKEVRWL